MFPIPMFLVSYVPQYLLHGYNVPRYLLFPVPRFLCSQFPGSYVPRFLCSSVPMFPGSYLRRTYVQTWASNDCSDMLTVFWILWFKPGRKTPYKIQDLLTYNRIHYLVWSAKPITHIHQSLGRVNDSQKIQVHYSTSLSWVLFRYLQRLNTTSWHAITLKHSWIYKLFTSDKRRLLYLSRNPKRN